MNAAAIRSSLLRAMRGKLSQAQLSQRLGFNFNQVYRWESGTNRIMWADFLKICRLKKIDMAKALDISLHYKGKPADEVALTKRFSEGRSTKELCDILGVSRFTLQRWLAGSTRLPLDEVLKMVHAEDLLDLFVGQIVAIEKIPELHSEVERKERLKKLFLESPMIGAFLLALDLSSYRDLPRHRAGWLAALLGITPALEEALVMEAKACGLIQERQGKLVRVSAVFNTRKFPEAHRAMREYWMKRGSESVEGTHGFAVLALNEETEAKLTEGMVKFSNLLNSLSAEGQATADRIKVITLQVFEPTVKKI